MTDLMKLAEPFPPTDIEWRIGQSGKRDGGEMWAKVLAYITNRAIMERLDSVVGPSNWKNEYQEWFPGGDGKTVSPGVLCGISIRIDGEWVTKWDGAEQTDIESVKGGLSNAMKRAAVQWGIGRYLYDLEELWAKCFASKQPGAHFAKTKDGTFYWTPPALPVWALPSEKNHAAPDGVQATPLASGTPEPTRILGECPPISFNEKGKFWALPVDVDANVAELAKELGWKKSRKTGQRWTDEEIKVEVFRAAFYTETVADYPRALKDDPPLPFEQASPNEVTR